MPPDHRWAFTIIRIMLTCHCPRDAMGPSVRNLYSWLHCTVARQLGQFRGPHSIQPSFFMEIVMNFENDKLLERPAIGKCTLQLKLAYRPGANLGQCISVTLASGSSLPAKNASWVQFSWSRSGLRSEHGFEQFKNFAIIAWHFWTSASLGGRL